MKKVVIGVLIVIIVILLLLSCTSKYYDLEQSSRSDLVYNEDFGSLYYIIGHGLTSCYIWDENTQDFYIGHYPEDWDDNK